MLPHTFIALFDGRSIRTYVQGENLNRYADDIQDYRMLVTYNGKSFDVPYMVLPENPFRIDLRTVDAVITPYF